MMVSTRCGEYTTPDKTPHLPLPPPDEDDDNNNNGGEGVAVGASLSFDDDSSSVDNNVGVDNEDDDSYHNNDDDDDNEEEMEASQVRRNTKRQHGMMMEEEEAGDEEDEEVEGIYVRLSVKSKSKMSNEDLLIHFDNRFETRASSICPNSQCDCLAILRNRNARSAVARYVAWFKKKETYEQNSIVFEWYRYSSLHRLPGKGSPNLFRLPYIDDGTEDIPKMVRDHVLCSRGLQFILDWGRKRFTRIRKSSRNTSVLPLHKSTGKTSYNAIVNDPERLEPLRNHFEYLKQLGEVRATRVITTLVDGMIQQRNRNDATASSNVTYLPISLGYRPCYRRYLSSLGYRAETTESGSFTISRDDGGAIDTGEFVSYTTYYNVWKRDYPDLKVRGYSGQP